MVLGGNEPSNVEPPVSRIRLRHQLIDVPTENPFASDQLNREVQVRNLAKLVCSARTPCVFAIDAPWGSGKTTFAGMLSAVLQLDGVQSVWLNAWQQDYSGDPLVDLLNQVKVQIHPKEPIVINALKVLADKGMVIARSVCSPLSRLLLLDNPVGAAAMESVADVVIDSVEAKMASWGTAPSDLESFRNSLIELVTAFAGSSQAADNVQLVFFVDELDRCRPSYAIEMMECIKHLFDVEGVAFVLSLDMEQLSCLVRNRYGIETRAEGYLGKLIDFTYRLPEPDRKKYAEYLYETYDIRRIAAEQIGEDQNRIPYARDFLAICGSLFNLSLRDMEKCFALLRVLLQNADPNEIVFPTFTSFLIVLRHQNRDLYYGYVHGEIEWTAVWSYLEGQPLFGSLICESSENRDHYDFLKACLRCSRMDSRKITAFVNELRTSNPQMPENELSNMMTVAKYSHYGPVLDLKIARLELLEGLD